MLSATIMLKSLFLVTQYQRKPDLHHVASASRSARAESGLPLGRTHGSHSSGSQATPFAMATRRSAFSISCLPPGMCPVAVRGSFVAVSWCAQKVTLNPFTIAYANLFHSFVFFAPLAALEARNIHCNERLVGELKFAFLPVRLDGVRGLITI